MAGEAERSEVTVRVRRCRSSLARMTPTPASFRWQVDRIRRTRAHKQPFVLGTSGLGQRHYGLFNEKGKLPSPRMDPVPVWPPDIEQTSLTCWDCGLRSSARLAELRARADRAERQGKTVVLFP
jgi:hypothetical protein